MTCDHGGLSRRQLQLQLFCCRSVTHFLKFLSSRRTMSLGSIISCPLGSWYCMGVKFCDVFPKGDMHSRHHKKERDGSSQLQPISKHFGEDSSAEATRHCNESNTLPGIRQEAYTFVPRNRQKSRAAAVGERWRGKQHCLLHP